MDKTKVRGFERASRMLMKLDNKLWESHGWKLVSSCGGDVHQGIYRREVLKALDAKYSTHKRIISGVVGLILEDANYHTMNSILVAEGVFTTDPWSDERNGKLYEDFRNSGGRTWNL